MHTYEVTVTRDGRWWMITVPELDGYASADGSINVNDTTQARRLADVPTQAREFICTVTDTAPSKVQMAITITVDDIDVTARARRLAEDREAAERHAASAATQAKELARDLAAHGVAVRDVGQILGVSFQRAQQLTTA